MRIFFRKSLVMEPTGRLPSRRDWLRLGLPTLVAAARPARGSTESVPGFGRAKSVLVVYTSGGQSQHETWDPKPDASVEVRGDLKPIRSATPGLLVGELMPRTARLTGKIGVLRGVSTNDNAHSASGYYMTTGVPHAPMQVENAKPGAPNDWPSMGGVVRKLLQPRCKLPAAVTLPEQTANAGNLTWPGQDGGFLGRAADPWLINCEPEKGKFEVPGLALPVDVPTARFDGRKGLLEALDKRSGTESARNDSAPAPTFSLPSASTIGAIPV